MATSTVEDYLKAILLEENSRPGELVSTGTIAGSLQVSPGTVTAMMKTLSQSGLVRYQPYSGVALTESGRQLAAHVLRRHRLLEQFLVKVVKMNWSEVHEEADQLEHAVSDRLLERIDELLGHPERDPHGDPIPTQEGLMEEPDHPDLLACPVGEPLQVSRVLDQSPSFLILVEERGLVPGRRLTVISRDPAADTVHLVLDGNDELSLGFRAASKILVQRV